MMFSKVIEAYALNGDPHATIAAVAASLYARAMSWPSDKILVAAAAKVANDVMQQYLDPDRDQSNKYQRVTLLGHSRGAALDSEVARILWEEGYHNIEFIGLDGYDADWPNQGGVLSNISIERNLLGFQNNIESVNIRAENGLETDPAIEEAISDHVFYLQARERFLANHSGENSLRTPARSSFDEEFNLPGSHHTTITEKFVNYGYLESFTYAAIHAKAGTPSSAESESGEAGTSPPTAKTSSPSPLSYEDLAFVDGDFELTKQLCDASKPLDGQPTGLAELDDLLKSPNCADLAKLFWQTTGSVVWRDNNSNGILQLSYSDQGTSSFQQLAIVPEEGSFLEFDYTVTNGVGGQSIAVEQDGARIFDSRQWPNNSRLHVQLPIVGIDTGNEFSFRLLGNANPDTRVEFDNIEITKAPVEQPTWTQFTAALPILANTSTTSSNLGVSVATLSEEVHDDSTDGHRGIAIVSARSDVGRVQYALNAGGSWSGLPEIPPGSALVLAADDATRIRFLSQRELSGCLPDLLEIRAFRYDDSSRVMSGDLVSLASLDGFAISADSDFVSAAVVNSQSWWRNWHDPLDVNNDSSVSPIDALVIINELNNPQSVDEHGHLPDSPTFVRSYFDTNADSFATALDVLILINFLNGAPRNTLTSPWDSASNDIVCPKVKNVATSDSGTDFEKSGFGPTTIEVTFSEALSTETLAPSNFALRDDNGAIIVQQQFAIASDNRSVVIRYAPLTERRYWLTIDENKLRDSSGNPLGIQSRTRPISGGLPFIEGLIGSWPFDGVDPTRNTVEASATDLIGGEVVAGRGSGTAIAFDGVDDGMRVSVGSRIDRLQQFTVSVWVRAEANQPSNDGLFGVIDKSHGFDSGATGWVFQGETGSGDIRFAVADGVDYPSLVTSHDLLDGRYHHLVGVVTPHEMRLYLDGELTGTRAITYDPATNTGDLYFGRVRGSGNTTRAFHGDLDDVAIWNRPLTGDEIATLYGEGLGVALPDLTRPLLTDIRPRDFRLDRGSMIAHSIEYHFSEPIKDEVLNSSNIVLRDGSGALVEPVGVHLSADRRAATFSYPLAPDTTYRIEVNESAIRDDAGNTLGTTNRQHELRTPPAALFVDEFETTPSLLWNHESGSWSVAAGAYDSTSQNSGQLSLSSLPFVLEDLVLNVDVNHQADGGIWLRSINSRNGVFLRMTRNGDGQNGFAWEVFEGGQITDSKDWAPSGVPVDLATVRLTVTATDNQFAIYVDGSGEPISTFTSDKFPRGRVALADGSGQSFDNFSLIDVSEFASNAEIPESGLVGWWGAEESAKDQIGENDGELGSTTTVPGYLGQAFRFNGPSDRVVIPDANSLDFSDEDTMSITTWVLIENPTSVMHLLGKRDGCGSEYDFYQLAIAPPDLSREEFAPGTWVHLAETFGDHQVRVYVNGVLFIHATAELGTSNSAPFVLGTSGTCDGLVGQLDEVRIYNRTLSEDEISASVNAEAMMRGQLTRAHGDGQLRPAQVDEFFATDALFHE